VEIRVPKTEREGTVSGYFNDRQKLAQAIAQRNGSGPGVYLTINPVKPALLARAENRLKIRVRATTSDADIERRTWLLIDCDPARPSDISSSDAEHEAALERARDIRMILREEGWPEPVLADSGNGAHLLYRIDLPNDESVKALIEAALKALARRFDDDAVKVDPAVFNAARIGKAYGTVAAKGDSTVERPHRLSRLLEIPPTLEAVSSELLAQCERVPNTPPPRAEKETFGGFDLDGFIRRYLPARDPVPHEGGRKWVLEACPFNEGHKAPDAAVFQRANGQIGFKCLHASCAHKHWADVRMLFEPRPSARADAPWREPHLTTAEELLNMNLPRPDYIIADIITTPGAYRIQGIDKSGKTILAAQTALNFYHGHAWLGEYGMLASGSILIIEKDDPNGLVSFQDILNKYPERKSPMSGFFLIAGEDAKRLTFGSAFIEYLERTIRANRIKLAVLDSYTALRGSRPPGIDIVKIESEDFGQLEEVAIRTGCVILIVHHESKTAGAKDFDQRGAGTYAIGQATAGLISVARFGDLPGNAPERHVQIRGRHIRGAELVVKFRESTLDYEFVMKGAASSQYVNIQRIKAHLGARPFAAKELYHGDEGMFQRATAYNILSRLVYGNVLTRSHGQYCWSAL
jgi:hypothetical protein